MPFLGSQTLPVSSVQGSEVAGTPSVSPDQVPPPPGSPQGCRSQASNTAALISVPFIPWMPTLPGFLSTVLAYEVIPAELLTASLLLSAVAPLNEELCRHLAVPHVHLFTHFPRMCWSSAPDPARCWSLGCGHCQDHSCEAGWGPGQEGLWAGQEAACGRGRSACGRGRRARGRGGTACGRGGRACGRGRTACERGRRWPGKALTPHSRACLPAAQLRDPLTTLAYEPAPHPAPRSSHCGVTPSPPPPSLWL